MYLLLILENGSDKYDNINRDKKKQLISNLKIYHRIYKVSSCILY